MRVWLMVREQWHAAVTATDQQNYAPGRSCTPQPLRARPQPHPPLGLPAWQIAAVVSFTTNDTNAACMPPWPSLHVQHLMNVPINQQTYPVG